MSRIRAHRTLRSLSASALMLALLLLSTRLPALEDDTKQPLYLEADSAVLEDTKSVSIYKGNVFVKQGSMELRGDEVTVHHDAQRKPKRVIAVGAPATYRQQVEGEKKEVEAEARRMEYDAAKDELVLIDKAVLFQGKDTFRSDRIVYDRTLGRVKAGAIARGRQRVKITITPSRK